MKTNILVCQLTALLLTTLMLSCHQEEVTPPVESIDLLMIKETNTIYTTYKSNFLNPAGPDSISYGSTTFYNRHSQQEIYEYDTLRRIIRHKTVDVLRPNDTYLGVNMTLECKYGNDNTVSFYSTRSGTNEPCTLNPDGFILSTATSHYTYDQNGYRIKDEFSGGAKYERTIFKGNVVQQVLTAYGAITKTTYQYDLTKPALPDPFRTLYGKQSQNLLIGTVETNGATKIVKTYSYEYDQQGLPKRRKAFIEWIDTAAKTTEKQVHITDFEYVK